MSGDTFLCGSRQLRAGWFRVRGYGLTVGWHTPLPSARRHWNWHHVGPVWWRVLRPSETPKPFPKTVSRL